MRKNKSNKLWLKPRGIAGAPSRTWFRILLHAETKFSWFGREAYNPTAPIEEFPKTSWEPVVQKREEENAA